MEESIKYFVPDISDIRVGYECERKSTGIEKDTHWIPCIMDFYDMQNVVIEKRPDWYRVPHLTKEQIEAEGWETAREYPAAHFKKDIDENGYYSITLNENNQIVITKAFLDGWAWKWSPFYSGECKDINTFRYICKLLNIGYRYTFHIFWACFLWLACTYKHPERRTGTLGLGSLFLYLDGTVPGRTRL